MSQALPPSTYRFARMTPETARTIADEWRYPPPYDFYDADADPEDYAELVTPEEWPEVIEQALDGEELIGFLTAERGDDGAWSIGLGMRPDLTGRGVGESFVRACLARLHELVPGEAPQRMASRSPRAPSTPRTAAVASSSQCSGASG